MGRIILVPLALLLAASASMFVFITLGLERITAVLHQSAPGDETFNAMFGLLGQGIALSTGLTVVPALLMALAGEVARIRSALYYVIGGGAALAAIPLLAHAGQAGPMPDPTVWQVFATAGFAGGFVYWLLAGRTA